MKLSWGVKITVLYVAFVLMILTLVFFSSMLSRDLVRPDYYREELNFEKHLSAVENAAPYLDSIKVVRTKDFLKVLIPKKFSNINTKVDLWIYCPSDARKDKRMKLPNVSTGFQISINQLKPSGYLLKMEFDDNEKKYFVEKEFLVK